MFVIFSSEFPISVFTSDLRVVFAKSSAKTIAKSRVFTCKTWSYNINVSFHMFQKVCVFSQQWIFQGLGPQLQLRVFTKKQSNREWLDDKEFKISTFSTDTWKLVEKNKWSSLLWTTSDRCYCLNVDFFVFRYLILYISHKLKISFILFKDLIILLMLCIAVLASHQRFQIFD